MSDPVPAPGHNRAVRVVMKIAKWTAVTFTGVECATLTAQILDAYCKVPAAGV
jgi:hypothetical protein